MYGVIFDVVILSLNRVGVQWMVAVAGRCRAWRRAWPSSLEAF